MLPSSSLLFFSRRLSPFQFPPPPFLCWMGNSSAQQRQEFAEHRPAVLALLPCLYDMSPTRCMRRSLSFSPFFRVSLKTLLARRSSLSGLALKTCSFSVPSSHGTRRSSFPMLRIFLLRLCLLTVWRQTPRPEDPLLTPI